jgi:hypothetical protein
MQHKIIMNIVRMDVRNDIVVQEGSEEVKRGHHGMQAELYGGWQCAVENQQWAARIYHARWRIDT